jgi:DNA-binding XRE family transcriptional regulator
MTNNLRSYREERMLSKAELARKAGISPLTVDRVESGLSCRLATMRKILFALDLDVTERTKVFPVLR